MALLSATATTTNKNTISAHTNNSVNHTSINLIPSSIDEESNESEECDNTYAAQQEAKENVPSSNSDQWKKGTLIVGDLMLAGLGEAKLSRRKRIKVRHFPGGKTGDL